MARKKSTTQTKTAVTMSQPKLQMMRQWGGIYLPEVSESWEYPSDENAQTDLPFNYLLVQNNVDTTPQKTLETRAKDYRLQEAPEGFELTGVTYMKGPMLYAVVTKDGKYGVSYFDVSVEDPLWIPVPFRYNRIDDMQPVHDDVLLVDIELTNIYSYLNDYVPHLIVMGYSDGKGVMFTVPLDIDVPVDTERLENSPEIPAPYMKPVIIAHHVLPWERLYMAWKARIRSGSIRNVQQTHVDDDVDPHLEYGGFVIDRDGMALDPDKWYIEGSRDEYGNITTSGDVTIGRVLYPYEKNLAVDPNGYPNISLSKGYADMLLLDDGAEFDMAYIYRKYSDATKAPSTVTPNEWVYDVDNTVLTLDHVKISRWGGSADSYIDISGVSGDYKDVATAMSANPPSGTDWVRYGVDKRGRTWVLFRSRRGSDYDDELFEIDSPNYGVILDPESDYVSSIDFVSAFSNKYGQTTLGVDATAHIDVSYPVAGWNSGHYVELRMPVYPDFGQTELDYYVLMNDSVTPTWIARAGISDGAVDIVNWYGSDDGLGENEDRNIEPSDFNTTQGPDARWCRMHDGRLYFWGSTTMPYRLYIGGNPKHELSIAIGDGGGYLDIEPGIGTIVNGTYKWKTASGASIVTILCGNENTSSLKRFNLIETNTTVNSELAEQSWSSEEVSNTVGCQSVYGAGVWEDGFYVLNRYGVTITTHAMEYNSQVQSQIISEAVSPIFTDNMGTMMENARMIYVDGVVYICFGTVDGTVGELDDVILCYDIGAKAWYTYTYGKQGDHQPEIRHLMNVDYKGSIEGIGIVCKDHIGLIPTTGLMPLEKPRMVPYKLETGELGTTTPSQGSAYVAQVELRFDWFIGDMDVDLVGVDYYGRKVVVHKHIHREYADHDVVEWMRVNCYLENYHITMRGEAMFRLTHFICKVYPCDSRLAITRGFDSLKLYRDAHGRHGLDHHYIRNYANLKDVILT